MNDRYCRDERGATLMDVVICVVSLGVLMAIAAPQVKSISQNMRLKAAARQLYGHFQQAKIEAIKRNETVLIVFDTSKGSYRMFVDTLPVNDKNRKLDDGEDVLFEQKLEQDVELVSANFGGTTIGGFTPQGRPSGGTGHVIIRNPETGREFKLTTSIAGYVHLK